MVKQKKKFYVTTAIAYVNAEPHIGFTLEVIQADALARWHRQLGEDVFFLTGTDEHGVKLYQTAKKLGLTPKQLADRNAAKFKQLAKTLNLSNDFFIRTSDKKIHWPGVQKLWKLLVKSGDIYKKKYVGKYCVGCERFITEKDLVNGECPYHPGKPLETIDEENYFFRLSKYQKKIERLIESDKYKIIPEKRKKEILSFIRSGLEDVSFSRRKSILPWGVPVPGDPDQVIYVWCDALPNYLTGIGFGRGNKWKKWWPADVHIIGKDITRFHAIYWPAMLISAGLPTPRRLFVHGFITKDGKKMSKSLGNVVNPFEEVKKYGADAVRYFLLREIPAGEDGDYSEKAVAQRINSELADELGNFVSRSLTLILKFGGGKVPSGKPDRQLLGFAKKTLKQAGKRMDSCQFHLALEEIWKFVKECNNYVQKTQPWTKPANLNNILYTLAESLRWISAFVWPFIPESAEKIARQIGLKRPPTFEELANPIKPGTKVKKGEILFKKVEIKPEKAPKSEVKPMVSFKEFEKLDLRVGKILSVEDHPNADKLYKMIVDFGEFKRQVIAGLKKWYRPNELKGKLAVFIVNLEPATIRGEKSEAMILAAEKDGKVVLITPEKSLPVGAKIS